METIKRIFGILVSFALWCIILLAALFTFTTLATRDANKLGNIAGFTPLLVESNSMAPTFEQGDLIVIKRCDTSEIQEGDIITFHTIIDNQFALNTHRIVAINEMDGIRSYITKGDNNEIEDVRNVTDGDVVGRYILKNKLLGKALSFLTSSVGFLVVIVLPMLCFFIYQIYHLVMVGINLKKAIAVESAQEEFEKQESLREEAERTKAELEKAKAELEELKRLKEEQQQ